jgi:hypothetical protein
VSILRRITKLEERRQSGAPDASLVYYQDGRAEAVLHATGERLPRKEYARRWPGRTALKAYLADEHGECVLDWV